VQSNQADVVVVGGGLAAHRAAIEACSQGAEVIMLEKMSEIGGSTVLSGGSFAFAGTELQKRNGVDDGPEKLRRDLIEVGGGQSDASLVDLYVREQLSEYEFLVSRGVTFNSLQSSSGQSVPRTHSADPRKVLDTLHAELKRTRGARVVMGARAMRLLGDARDGGLHELVVDVGGRREVVRAGHGIVLATGGFSRGRDLLRLVVPELCDALPGGGPGNEGDGLKIAWEHGAAFADLGYVKGTFGAYVEVDPKDPTTRPLLPVYRGAIAVNREGLRFTDESQSYKTLGKACLQQESARAYQVFDDRIMSQSVDHVPSFDFRAAERKGQIVSADMLAALAAKIGVDPARFAATVAAYNEDAKAGVDRQFNRRTLVHRYGSIVGIEKPPFYAYPCTTAIHSTYAGLRVRDDMTVLNVWGEPLAGLYAAGEVVGGFHGVAYMTGSSLVKALVFGKVAARSALGGRR